MRIVLTQERKLYVLENPSPEEPANDGPRAQGTAYEKHFNDSMVVACLMVQKNQGKGKGKGKRKGKATVGETKLGDKPNPQPAKKAKPSRDAICFFCQMSRHWKWNCKLYLEDQKKKKSGEVSTSGIFVIDVHFSTLTTWEFKAQNAAEAEI